MDPWIVLLLGLLFKPENINMEELPYGCLITKCRKQNDKPIPVVHPTIDCRHFSVEE